MFSYLCNYREKFSCWLCFSIFFILFSIWVKLLSKVLMRTWMNETFCSTFMNFKWKIDGFKQHIKNMFNKFSSYLFTYIYIYIYIWILSPWVQGIFIISKGLTNVHIYIYIQYPLINKIFPRCWKVGWSFPYFQLASC